jgi:predicted nucleic acid-binding protein
VALILDTGPLYASLDRRDRDHARCRRLIEESEETLVIPSPVLPELDYLVSERMGAAPMLALLGDVERGAYVVENLLPDDYVRVRQLMDRHADQDLGFVDSAVFAVVERLGERKLATLDHRHFTVLRPRHVDALDLLPA